MLYGTTTVLPEGASSFANQVVEMFTNFIGDWSYLIIAAASFSIMFGTCITVFDGYGRSISRSMALLRSEGTGKQVKSNSTVYIWGIIVVILGSYIIVHFLMGRLKELVDVATTLSFVIAPIIAIVNYRLVTGNLVDDSHKPPLWLKILSWSGIVFLSGFALYYLLFLSIFR